MRLSNPILAALIVVGAGLVAQKPARAPAPTLYLLAATPTADAQRGAHLANLYWVTAEHKTKLARVIVGLSPSISDVTGGIQSVIDNQASGYFVIAPMFVFGNASITAISQREPLADVRATLVPPFAMLATVDSAGCFGCLIANTPIGNKGYFVGARLVRLKPAADGGGMVLTASLREFAGMRDNGRWTGANPVTKKFLAQAVGLSLTIPAWDKHPGLQPICPLPPDLPARDRAMTLPETVKYADGRTEMVSGPVTLTILFATNRFFGFQGQRPGGPQQPESTAYIYDRQRHSWQEPLLPQPYGMDLVRVFGDWLASPVITRKPADADPNRALPEAEAERNWWSPRYPDVFQAYEYLLGDWRMPGEIQLLNLADHRVITLTTHIRDTEILALDPDGTMLYRADDSIFRTRIDGNTLAPATLLAQGDDVPEMHWAFWSSQPPPAQPVGMESAIPHP